MKKYFMLVCCLMCCVCFIACSHESQQRIEEDSNLYGNLEIKDEDGNIVINIGDIKSVEVSTEEEADSNKKYFVGVEFTEDGADKLAQVTKTHNGEILSIYVDAELVATPMITAVIENGYVQIVGYRTYEEAENLVNKIKGSKNNAANTEHISGVVKITENDGTILLESTQIEYASMETRSIGKGGSNVEVIVLYFTDEGAAMMESKTKKLIGEEINVVVYGELVYSKVLQETISNGELVINTSENYSEISELWSKIQDGK